MPSESFARGFDPRYELHPLPLGSGGMAEVLEAFDTRLGRTVAVKFARFPAELPDTELARRFVRESRITARLEHPGVPAVHDTGTHQGRPYLVMERVEGVSLADVVAELGPLPAGWAASIGAQVGAVLAAAHAAGLVHRDLKPDNLILQPAGTVKVLDFGLAVGEGTPELSRITQTGQVLGTPGYMAPEQVEQGRTTPKADLYSLGCTLYELVTGRPPFTASTSYAVMVQQVSHEPASVRTLRPDTPRELAAVVTSLVRKRPEDRPDDALSVYRALLPLARELPPLPGMVGAPQEPSPARMYAAAAARYGTDATAPADPGPDIDAALSQAGAFARDSRHGEAAALLEHTLVAARRARGDDDPRVTAMWWEWAESLANAGDYPSAARAYGELAAALAHTGQVELRLRCTRRQANCLADADRSDEAITLLRRLLADTDHAYGGDDARTLDLRRQIAMMLLRTRSPHAHTELRDLRRDLVRLHGPEHPSVRQIEQLLG